MRILANENFPGEALKALRARGDAAAWVRTDSPGASDEAVLRHAASEQRLVITLDKGFGELAFHSGLPAPCGIVLFRIPPRSAKHVTQTAVAVFESRGDWAGHFSVVEEDRVRMTSLPSQAPRTETS